VNKGDLLVRKVGAGLHSVLFELQIEYKCARVVRVCVHVPSSPPSAAVTKKKRTRAAAAGWQRKMDATQRVISGLLLFTLATLHLGKSPRLLTSGHDAIADRAMGRTS